MDGFAEKRLPPRKHRLRHVLEVLVGITLLLLILYGCRLIFLGAPRPLPVEAKPPAVLRPLTSDEQAALRWLDHILQPLPEQEERQWWQVGGRQFGLSSIRYHIAFAGYAAAALGIRGDAGQRAVVGRILENCITRYLRREVWAYSQAKSYWGKKPWAPDPCYRENVMYTGHLLQLLALYECFTGDTKYWTRGFDFVWDGQKRVHYDVRKLIDVTVEQMRAGNGGVTCEPGLLFFPCNNHPHFALKLFAALGHGDWSQEAKRWEKWALTRYHRPLMGGGALNLLCHAPSGIFYPRGYSGLDAWAILWYEPWAPDRGSALALWQEAKALLEWEGFAAPADATPKANDCMDPQQVPDTVLAVFLAAAARACDDPETAERLERPLDAKYLCRNNGFYRLDVKREWRIGATAMRILALAEANGSRFREWSEHPRRAAASSPGQ